MSKTYCVYILASRSRNLYAGVTNNLHRRLAEHHLGVVPGFTSRYKIFRLVHYEVFNDIRAAIAREKQIKAWRRERKVWLIEGENSTWSDLSEGWFRDEQKRKSLKASSGNVKESSTADPSHRPKYGRVRDDSLTAKAGDRVPFLR